MTTIIGTSYTAFMRDLEERFRQASGLLNRAHYKIFYGQVRPAMNGYSASSLVDPRNLQPVRFNVAQPRGRIRDAAGAEF